jgi:hypothetical protein
MSTKLVAKGEDVGNLVLALVGTRFGDPKGQAKPSERLTVKFNTKSEFTQAAYLGIETGSAIRHELSLSR